MNDIAKKKNLFLLSCSVVWLFAGCGSSGKSEQLGDASVDDDSRDRQGIDSEKTDSEKNDIDSEKTDKEDTADDQNSDFVACAETVANAVQENATSNLIIAVDTSGSMNKETEMVQLNINNRFAEKFGSKPTVDVHIVLISKGLSDPDGRGDGMCVFEPLGSGQCPEDTNPDKLFWHIHQTVGSHNSLLHFIECYDGGPSGTRCDDEGHWKDFISPGGFVHFVVVSDDNSSMTADEFDLWATGEFGDNYMFHGIVSSTDGRGDNITPECDEYSANEGAVYKELIARTNGIFGDLCLQDNNEFDAVFDQITTEVITHVTMPCQWTLPSPPDDSELDPELVNVEFASASGSQKIGKVVSRDKCDEVAEGWYYDDENEPTQILICPQTCDWIQGKPEAEMRIKFGCKTEPAGPIL